MINLFDYRKAGYPRHSFQTALRRDPPVTLVPIERLLDEVEAREIRIVKDFGLIARIILCRLEISFAAADHRHHKHRVAADGSDLFQCVQRMFEVIQDTDEEDDIELQSQGLDFV